MAKHIVSREPSKEGLFANARGNALYEAGDFEGSAAAFGRAIELESARVDEQPSLTAQYNAGLAELQCASAEVRTRGRARLREVEPKLRAAGLDVIED